MLRRPGASTSGQHLRRLAGRLGCEHAGVTPFAKRVLDVVDQIPSGRVMSYGDVRDYLGEGSARGVGAVMRRYGVEVPWHRVVMADGSVATHKADRQLDLLAAEGVPIVDGRVDMRAARWSGR